MSNDIDWDRVPPLRDMKWDADCEYSRKYQAATEQLAERDREIRELRGKVEQHRAAIACLVAAAGGMVSVPYGDLGNADETVDVFGYAGELIVFRVGTRYDPADYIELDEKVDLLAAGRPTT